MGVVVWERDGADITLVSLSRGFHERILSKAPYPIELVCDDCGTTQPE